MKKVMCCVLVGGIVLRGGGVRSGGVEGKEERKSEIRVEGSGSV